MAVDRDAVRRPTVPRPLAVAAGWSWRLVAVAIAAALVLLLLVRLRIVVLPVIVALLAVTVLHPVMRRLRERGWPALLATWTVVLGSLAVLAGVVAALSWRVAGELEELDLSLEEGVADVEDWLVTGPLGLSRARLDEAYDQARDWLTSGEGLLSGGVLGQAALAIEVVAGLVLTLVLVFFLLKDGERMWAWLIDRLGPDAGPHVDETGARAWSALSGFIRGTAIVATVDTVLIGAAIAILGVPFVLALAALTFVGAFVPFVGAFVAGSAAVLVALATEGLVTALILLGVVVVVQQLEGNVLQPIVLGRAVDLHPVVILLGVTAGAVLGGVIGAFLAVPAIAVGSAVAGYIWERVGPREPVRTGRADST